MSAVEKAAVLARVETLAGRKRQALAELGIPRSTYYRWRQGQWHQGLDPHSGDGRRPWNRLTPEEDGKIRAAARQAPELSSRQLVSSLINRLRYLAALAKTCSAVFVHTKGLAPSFHRLRKAFMAPISCATLSKLPLRMA